MNTKKKQAETINKLSELLYEVGFYSVVGHYTVPKNFFDNIAKFSLENDVNGFEQYQFICCIDEDLNNFYSDSSYVFDVDYAERIKSYADGAMVLSPDDPHKYYRFATDIIKRREFVNSYESRRRIASIFTASKKNRDRIFDDKGKVCVKCGSTEKLSIDHIIPVIKGGTNDDDNLQVLCMPCNSSKGAK